MAQFWTILWSVILVNMVTYILGSMTSVAHLNFTTASIVGLVCGVVICLVGYASEVFEIKRAEQHH